MNNIKFRAWDKHQKKIFQVERIDFDFDTGDKVQTVHLVPNVLSDEGGWDDHPELAIHNVELMQFTGLRDYKGRNIFEGDILRIIWNPKRKEYSDKEVIWLNGAWRLTTFDVLDSDKAKQSIIIGDKFRGLNNKIVEEFEEAAKILLEDAS
jgi:uncharacterized phage protein (TIGR01671 family)